mmetsp:Transcript_14224/g.16966  ORF Transcript_14224/g.16966 Transcript_14224/m.16966 type:complete len:141 (-) Transcript_14224:797-1219(-)
MIKPEKAGWRADLELKERALMEAYDFRKDLDFKSGYLKLKLDNLDFQVRFSILEGPNETAATSIKPTLVLVHGYMCGGVSAFVQWFRLLVPHYRVVVFDNCGWGLNTRMTESTGLSTPERAEAWLLDFMTQSMNKLDLPE